MSAQCNLPKPKSMCQNSEMETSLFRNNKELRRRPVSYTHLDVYKRQDYGRLARSECSRSVQLCGCLLYTSRCV